MEKLSFCRLWNNVHKFEFELRLFKFLEDFGKIIKSLKHFCSHTKWEFLSTRFLMRLKWENLSKTWASLIAQLVKNPPAMKPWFYSWVRKIPWRKDRLPTPVILGFPRGSAGKESAHSTGDLGSIPGLGRSPGEGKGYPLQYSGLENSKDYIVLGVTKSQTQLSDFHF